MNDLFDPKQIKIGRTIYTLTPGAFIDFTESSEGWGFLEAYGRDGIDFAFNGVPCNVTITGRTLQKIPHGKKWFVRVKATFYLAGSEPETVSGWWLAKTR